MNRKTKIRRRYRCFYGIICAAGKYIEFGIVNTAIASKVYTNITGDAAPPAKITGISKLSAISIKTILILLSYLALAIWLSALLNH